MFDIKIKGSIGRIIIMLLVLSITIIGGTFAWFTYKSRESALVLSIGDINDSRVIIEPYQIRETLVPTGSYTGGVYSQITAINNNSNKLVMNLFYKVNQIDELLINNGLRYTIVSSDSKDGEYKEVDTGDFTGIKNNKLKILNTEIESNKTVYYRVYLWLDTNAGNQVAIQNSVLDVELNGDINQVANQPILDEGMVPVIIYEDGTVMTTTENDLDWYDYENQKWANIVLVNENASGSEGSKSREYYLNNPGTEVLESDILAYYVWIPRYKYKIWTTGVSSAGQEQSIDIVFESRYDEMSLGSNVGEYRTHPAFWWDNDNDSVYDEGEMLPGIWVGKFETTGDATTPTVKPNSASLTGQNISVQFNTSLLFAGGSMNTSTGEVTFTGNNTYGLTDKTNSHMMKNSEWGAAAYLSHSQYGINEEVRINNYYNNGTLTGCGASSANAATATTCGISYKTSSTESHTYPQSTTGNISGIFDMSGGVWEFVMGVLSDTNGKPRSGRAENLNSGFNGEYVNGQLTTGLIFPENKYFDLYLQSQFTSNGLVSCTIDDCGGHSLFETAGWYNDLAVFVSVNDSWLMRGGQNVSNGGGGIFSFHGDYGNANNSYGFRSVLIPNYNYTLTFDVNGGNEWVDISYTDVGEHEFDVPFDGKYQLEVWGAQGGVKSSSQYGGYGGYSTGVIELKNNDILYLNIGGQGEYDSSSNFGVGGYNGGGTGSSSGGSGGGGGATHIATVSGELSTLESYKGSLYSDSSTYNSSNILIVAGGGGGWANYSCSTAIGGSGGGYISQPATLSATQISGGTTSGQTGGSFGKGGYQSNIEHSTPGGGGGWYGGGTSSNICGGGGGSGYIGSSLLTNKYMYCYNCSTSDMEHFKTYTTTNVSTDSISNYAKSGNGAARIRQLTDKDIVYGYKYGNMPEPTREGYTFAGWYTEPEGGTKVTSDTIVDTRGNKKLYAYWSPINMNISYSVNGGIIASNTSDGSNTYNWTITNDAIYLNSALYNSDISGSDIINLPDYNDSSFMNISKNGYDVVNGKEWICLSGCKSNGLVFDQNVEYSVADFCNATSNQCNVVLGVNWAQQYTITYNLNGGTGSIESQIKTHGVTMQLTNDTPEKNGYKFLGWSTDDNATSATYASGTEFTDNRNTTLYAVWTGNTYTVTYYVGNGTSTAGTKQLGTSTCTYSSSCTLSTFANLGGIFPYSSADNTANGKTNYGWEFYGWTTSQTGTSSSYMDGQSITYSTIGNISLYAIGRKKINIHSGINPTTVYKTLYQYWNPYSTAETYLTSIDLPQPTAITGWEFIGYRGGSSDANSTVTFAASLAGTSFIPAYSVYPGVRSVYKRTLTLSYNANGGSGTTTNSTATQYYNSGYGSGGMNYEAKVSKPTFTLAANKFTRSGYTFSKWADGSTTGTQYAAGASYTGFAPAVDNSSTRTMYAIWLQNYTISYNMNGGTGSIASQTKVHGTAIKLSTTIPTRSGYQFLGWSTSSSAISSTYGVGSEYTTNASATLYAVWKMISPVQSYSCANGSVGSEPYVITYTGNCTMIDDGNNNWRIKFLTSGEFTSQTNITIDAFLVGGGGGGGYSGGGGGYTNTQKNISIVANQAYEIVVGAGGAPISSGGITRAFEYTANGGSNGGAASVGHYRGGNGGSGGGGAGAGAGSVGGRGGSNGGSGSSGYHAAGAGQGTTTREFGEENGTLYAGGGGGAGNGGGGSGGSGGGGGGGRPSSTRGGDGSTNTGGGGGGGYANDGGNGGSGIVVIRNVKNGTKCSGENIENIDFDYTYTGNCEIIDDGNGNFRIKFLTSGEFISQTDITIDAFLVGGGGGGGYSGGGGGYTITQKDISIVSNEKYEIIVGAGGGSLTSGEATQAFEYTANGGSNGGAASVGHYRGGNGGSGGGGAGSGDGAVGGSGGSNGGSGSSGYHAAGAGQGTTTREFGEENGTLYAGGGGGAGNGGGGSGGSGGGGGGGWYSSVNGGSGTPNTGGGGGGAYGSGLGGAGGSGIVVIRNVKQGTKCSGENTANVNFDYTYTGNCEIIDDGNGNWRIKFLSSGDFISKKDLAIDAFLVGGGGGGGYSGGGGGYTTTQKNISIVSNKKYEIVVGTGGSPISTGGTTKAFEYTANGGEYGGASSVGTYKAGNGGSGGGGAGSGDGAVGGGGGSNGSNGISMYHAAGTGQGTTTREFGEPTGTLYAGGGGGAGNGGGGAGGSGGGGGGGWYSSVNGGSGTPNTGGGGGGGYNSVGGSGGSGIVVIRNKR